MEMRISKAQMANMFSHTRLGLRRVAPAQTNDMTGAWVNIAHASSEMHRHLLDRVINKGSLGQVRPVFRETPFHLQRLIADMSVSLFATNLLLLSYYTREEAKENNGLEWRIANFFAANALEASVGKFVWDPRISSDAGFYKAQEKLLAREDFLDISRNADAIAGFLIKGEATLPFTPEIGSIETNNKKAMFVALTLYHVNRLLYSLVPSLGVPLDGAVGKGEPEAGVSGKRNWLVADAASDTYALGLLGWAALYAEQLGQDELLLWDMAMYFGTRILPKYLLGPGEIAYEMQRLRAQAAGEDLPETVIALAEAQRR